MNVTQVGILDREQQKAQIEMAKVTPGHLKHSDVLETLVRPSVPISGKNLKDRANQQEVKKASPETTRSGRPEPLWYSPTLRESVRGQQKCLARLTGVTHNAVGLEDDKVFAAFKNQNLSFTDPVNNGVINALVTGNTGLTPDVAAQAFAAVEQFDIPVANIIVNAQQQRDLRLWTNRNYDPVNIAAQLSNRLVCKRAISEKLPQAKKPLGQFRGKVSLRSGKIRRDYTLSTLVGDDIVRTVWQHTEPSRNVLARRVIVGNINRTQRELLKTGYLGDLWGAMVRQSRRQTAGEVNFLGDEIF